MRVVVYGEGGRELGEASRVLVRPGDVLPEEALGAAHWFVRRALEDKLGIPPHATRFEEPLRTARGRRPKGSDLLDRPTLRRLLTWPMPQRSPELAIVFVDEDGDGPRRQVLLRNVEDLPGHPKRVIAVPVREFEAWLITDWPCVQGTLDVVRDQPPAPEGFIPGEAKRLFAELFATSPRENESSVRIDLARQCNLEQVRGQSQSFRRFLDDLA